MRNSYLTVTDQFCGAGGSSLGAIAAGAEIRQAMNHWERALETYATNHPETEVDCTDVSACDPRRYPSTDILITSPECTNHSLAKGKQRKFQAQMEMFGKIVIDPSEERSRATMWDVPRFAEVHNYRLIVVENVVDARQWRLFDAWLHVLGLSSPAYAAAWQRIGVDSFDGASHFKQAFTAGKFFMEQDGQLTSYQAARPSIPVTAPACGCLACRRLWAEGVDTRSYGSNEHNMGRAAHNLNQLMRAINFIQERSLIC